MIANAIANNYDRGLRKKIQTVCVTKLNNYGALAEPKVPRWKNVSSSYQSLHTLGTEYEGQLGK